MSRRRRRRRRRRRPWVWQGSLWQGSLWQGSLWQGSLWQGSLWQGLLWQGSLWERPGNALRKNSIHFSPGPGPRKNSFHFSPGLARAGVEKWSKKHENGRDSDVIKAFWPFTKPDSVEKGQGTSWNHLGALKQEGKIQNLGFLGLRERGDVFCVFSVFFRRCSTFFDAASFN